MLDQSGQIPADNGASPAEDADINLTPQPQPSILRGGVPNIPADAICEDVTPPQGKLSKRRENRIAAMQYLYAWEVSRPANTVDDARRFFENQEHKREHYAFAEELVHGTIEHIADLDDTLQQYAENWTLKRIAKVDLTILRLAEFEFFYRDDIPPVVTINEAVELSKLFSTEESKRFINGILDRLKDRLTRPSREVVNK